MIKFLNIILEVILDWVKVIAYFITSNLRRLAWILNFLLPYAMYLIGQTVCVEREGFGVGAELFIPILVCIVIYFLKSIANKIGKGDTVPIPGNRFTHVDEDGEVSIEHSRLQELILYLADLEDWLERKGLL